MMRDALTQAYALIEGHADYELARFYLLVALKHVETKGQWSRIMVAIRYTNKLIAGS